MWTSISLVLLSLSVVVLLVNLWILDTKLNKLERNFELSEDHQDSLEQWISQLKKDE